MDGMIGWNLLQRIKKRVRKSPSQMLYLISLLKSSLLSFLLDLSLDLRISSKNQCEIVLQ